MEEELTRLSAHAVHIWRIAQAKINRNELLMKFAPEMEIGLNPVRGEALTGLAENLSDELGAAVANSVSKANMVRGTYLVLAREGVMDDSQAIVMARLSELLINACVELAAVIEDELNMKNGELQKRICTLETRIVGTKVGEGL